VTEVEVGIGATNGAADGDGDDLVPNAFSTRVL
jgi:hypothetical protein